MTSTPTEQERRLFGDLAEDVAYLRSRGKLVARFKGEYRVGTEVMSAIELRALATRLRSTIQPTPERPRATAATVAPSPRVCGCGKPSNHGGMCSERWKVRKANAANQSCGAASGQQSGGGEAESRLAPSRPSSTQPDVATGPQDPDRLARLEARVEDVIRWLGIAVRSRRESLELQCKGLVEIEAEINTN